MLPGGAAAAVTASSPVPSSVGSSETSSAASSVCGIFGSLFCRIFGSLFFRISSGSCYGLFQPSHGDGGRGITRVTAMCETISVQCLAHRTLMDCYSDGLYWTVTVMDCYSDGLCWTVTVMDCYSDGLLQWWTVTVLDCRNCQPGLHSSLPHLLSKVCTESLLTSGHSRHWIHHPKYSHGQGLDSVLGT